MRIKLPISAIALTLLLNATQARCDYIVSLAIAPGTFDLFIEDNNQASTLNTFGIASYSIPLLGSILSVDHKSPQGLTSSVQDVGFRLLRSPDNSLIVSASQNTFTSPIRVPDFGRTGGNLSSFIGVDMLIFSEQPIYDAKLLIASGTWNTLGVAPSVNVASVDFGGNAFANASLNSTSSAQMRLAVVPEPGPTLMIFFLLICLGYSRQRQCLKANNLGMDIHNLH